METNDNCNSGYYFEELKTIDAKGAGWLHLATPLGFLATVSRRMGMETDQCGNRVAMHTFWVVRDQRY